MLNTEVDASPPAAPAQPNRRLSGRGPLERVQWILLLSSLLSALMLAGLLAAIAADGRATAALAIPLLAGLVGGALAQLRLATERERVLRRVESDAHFRGLFEANPQPMWLYDVETLAIVAVNDAAVRHYGFGRTEFLGMTVTDLDAGNGPVPGDGQAPVRADAASTDGDHRHRLRDGRIIDVETASSRLEFQGRSVVLVLARDVTEQRELHRRLEHQAFHDSLTGLPNRARLDEHARRRLDPTAADSRTRLAMLVFDLDGFKVVNDTLGHAFGDRVIAEVGARLRANLRPGDTASRLGGDEFAILLGRTTSTDEAIAVARRVIAAIELPVVIDGRRVGITASVGIAFPRPEHRSLEDLLSDADVAMYVAKTQGTGSCVVFESGYRDALMDRLSLQEDLASALTSDQLSVEYQPQLDLRSGRVVAVEALVRWHLPARGLVPPDVFIPLAEQLGLVSAIDEMVLRTACHQLRIWCDDSDWSLRMAVNLSGRDLDRPEWAAMVRTTLLEYMLDPWQLELELTESVAVSQPEATVARLQELRAMGVRIAIDDFGTGYSMLTRLRHLPADRLKIDRSFVTDVGTDDDARTIVGSTITMGHALGLDLVAEGVETARTAAVLGELGCDYAQGYHFSRPLPAAQMTEWLHRHALVRRASTLAVG